MQSGLAVTVEAEVGVRRKYLQAGSGFLAQHSKELFFGVREAEAVRASIRWPGGMTQAFESVPVNHRIEIQEGSADFLAKSFRLHPRLIRGLARLSRQSFCPRLETWLIEPLSARSFLCPISTARCGI